MTLAEVLSNEELRQHEFPVTREKIFLGHAGVRVAEGRGHDLERHAGFGQETRVAVAQDVERDRRVNSGVETGLAHRAVLM